MPEQFDPAWEYREDNPELADVFPDANPFFSLFSRERGNKEPLVGRNYGYRFGHGSPDRHVLGDPEFVPIVDTSTVQARVCPTCQDIFKPARNAAIYCSKACRPYRGRSRILADIVCRCGRTFRPRWAGNRFCSRKCANEDCSDKFNAKSLVKLEPRLAQFRADYLSGVPMSRLVVSHGVSLAQLKRWRRKLGLLPRPPGNYSRTTAKPTPSD